MKIINTFTLEQKFKDFINKYNLKLGNHNSVSKYDEKYKGIFL